jgi:hypothetical protein
MAEFFSKFLSSFNFFPFFQRHIKGILLLFSFLGFLIIFLPSNIILFLNLEQFRMQYNSFIGLITLIFSASLFFLLIYDLVFYVYRQYFKIPKLIKSLTTPEVTLLQKYIESKTQTATLSLFNGIVSGLVKKEIIYKTDALANSTGLQDFNIDQTVYEYLINHPRMIKEEK